MVLLFSGLSCRKAEDRDRLRIVATVFPLAEFAENIVGPHGEVKLLLPPGAEAHSWRPRPSDMVGLAQADLIIFIGGGMEPWLQDILDSVDNPGLRELEASRGLMLLQEQEHLRSEHQHGPSSHSDDASEHRKEEITGRFDPHIWLDFANDQLIIRNLTRVLTQLAPLHSDFFQKRAESYIVQLQALDEAYRRGLAHCQNRTLILGGHAAFGYLAHRYDLVQIALFGLNPDAKPTVKQLKDVVDLAKEHRIEAVFFEEMVNEDLAHVLAEEISAQTLVLNPGANLTREQLEQGVTFLELMRINLDHLKKGLGCL
jgi:zinc transport system substrate-binding protein